MEHFVEKDLEQLDEFGKLINDRANWSLSTADAVKLYKSLIFINGLRKKISDHIVEYRSIQQVMEPIKKQRSKKQEGSEE